MKHYGRNLSIATIYYTFVLGIFGVLFIACQEKTPTKKPKVEIRKVDGEYNFYVNDTLFEVKGAGLDFNAGQDFKALAAAGANSFRTWRTDAAPMELDSALKYNLMIAMGIDMGKELHHFDYKNEEAVQQQFERIKAEVLKYKDHPALLCWVVGNELNLLIEEDGSLGKINPKAYDALCEIVDFIREVDPDHPITTTFAAGAPGDHIEVLLDRCPKLDFLSYQVYVELATLTQQEMANNLDIPYLVTEFGPKGHWERPTTAWGREIEENSTEKADGLRDRMEKGLKSDKTGRNMGGFAFIWGQKQERTPTWYGIFNKDGRATAVLDELTLFWSGSYPVNRAPAINSMKLNGQVGTDNISLKAGQAYTVDVSAFDYEEDELRYHWVLMEEVGVRSQGGAFEAEPQTIDIEILEEDGGRLQFRTPADKGEYRIFCYIYDEAKVANANIPFLVE